MTRTASASRQVRSIRPARNAMPAGARVLPNRSTTVASTSVPTVSGLIAVMTDLQTLLTAENDALRRGLPAVACENVEKKERLQKNFRSMYRYILRRGAPALAQTDAERLQELGLTLRSLAVENANRLEAALQASQQRIEQVMTALRERVSQEHASYNKEFSNVQSLRAHFSDFGKTVDV